MWNWFFIKCLRKKEDLFKKKVLRNVCTYQLVLFEWCFNLCTETQPSYGGSGNCFFVARSFLKHDRKALPVYLQEQLLFRVSIDALKINSSALNWFGFECKKWAQFSSLLTNPSNFVLDQVWSLKWYHCWTNADICFLVISADKHTSVVPESTHQNPVHLRSVFSVQWIILMIGCPEEKRQNKPWK